MSNRTGYKFGSKNGIALGYNFRNGIYDTVLLTDKDPFVVGNQQMAFDLKYFPLKDYRKSDPYLSTLYLTLGRVPRPTQFTNTSPSGSSTSDSEDDESSSSTFNYV